MEEEIFRRKDMNVCKEENFKSKRKSEGTEVKE